MKIEVCRRTHHDRQATESSSSSCIVKFRRPLCVFCKLFIASFADLCPRNMRTMILWKNAFCTKQFQLFIYQTLKRCLETGFLYEVGEFENQMEVKQNERSFDRLGYSGMYSLLFFVERSHVDYFEHHLRAFLNFEIVHLIILRRKDLLYSTQHMS